MSKLYYIGDTTYAVKYKTVSPFEEFVDWFLEQKVIGHDVETNVTSSILTRELRVLQYSDSTGDVIWTLQWSYLTPEQQATVRHLMRTSKAILIVFTNFEYTIWRKYGVVLNKIWDAYSAEKVINTGFTVEKGFYSLQGVYKRRFDIDLSKAQQLAFDDDVMTDEKVEYAAMDVYKLGSLMRLQIREAKAIDKRLGFVDRRGALKTMWWENEFSKVTGDMEFDGMNFDTNKWIENYHKALPIVEGKREELNSLLCHHFDLKVLKEEGFYVPEDTLVPKLWNSATKKTMALSLLFDGIEGTSKVALKQYLKDNDPNFPEGLKLSGKAWETSEYKYDYSDKFAVIKLLTHRSEDNKEIIEPALNNVFIANFREQLIENELLTPAKTVTINWASPVQRLKVFQWISPDIEDTAEQTVLDNWHAHAIFPIYHEFTKSNSLTTKFGMKYLENVDTDGRIRTRFDPVLSTGRIASSGPNLLQLPRIQDYRDPFISSPKWKFVGADYSSEEILIIAILSQDPVWLKSFKDGDDVHSVNASLIYGEEWIRATEPDCVFAQDKQKCDCQGHKDMRSKSKAISFGLAYGLSAHGASIRLKITLKEAQLLIDRFFKAFPNIKSKLEALAAFGVAKGFIAEPVLGRPRFYDMWKVNIIRRLENFEGDMSYKETREANKQKASIERESKNQPIQGAGAGILKISGVLLRRWIRNNNLENHIRLLLPPHDEWCLEAKNGYEELARDRLKHYMELAGKLGLHTDLLKAEPYINEHWVK